MIRLWASASRRPDFRVPAADAREFTEHQARESSYCAGYFLGGAAKLSLGVRVTEMVRHGAVLAIR